MIPLERRSRKLETFESALATLQSDAEATQKAAATLAATAKKLAAAAQTGDAAAIEKALADGAKQLAVVQQQFNNTHSEWSFKLPAYIETGEYLEELQRTAASAGLALHDQDGRIFS